MRTDLPTNKLAEAGVVVIPPESLATASPEEKEAYYQYLIQEAKRIDDWEVWLKLLFANVANKPFSKGHEELWKWVWAIEKNSKPKPYIAVLPRGHGKSSSTELAVVATAARQTRKYCLYICETQSQADDHVANIAALLESNSLELAYPNLGEKLLGKFGNAKGWRRNRIRTRTGFTVDAMGLDSAARGVKLEDQRPDFLVLDDVDGELDTEHETGKKIKTITQKIFPAGSQDSAVLMVQNLVHENSIFARLVDGRADFLKNRIVLGPIPAIWNMEYEEQNGQFVITAGSPSWPEGFPVDSCQDLMNEIGLTAFLAECQHETKPPSGDIFNHLIFQHADFEMLPRMRKTVVFVDPAVTSTDTSDSMGIQVDSLGADGKIYRLWSWEQRSTPKVAIRKAVEKAIEHNADIVGVETNQGGILWRDVYDDTVEEIRRERAQRGEDFFSAMPRYKEIKVSKDSGSKVVRAQRMLVDYERNKIVHVRGTHLTLETSLRRFPRVKPYDLVDACFHSWNELAGRGASRKSSVSSAARRILASH